MSDAEDESQRMFAARVAAAATSDEKEALRRWIEQLLVDARD